MGMVIQRLCSAGIWVLFPSFVLAFQPRERSADAAFYTDTVKVKVLIDSAQRKLASDPQTSLILIQQALILSRQAADAHNEAIALTILAECHNRLSDYALAVEKAMEALQKAQDHHNEYALAKAHRVLGIIYTLGLKQYDKAQEHQLQAFELYKKLNDPRNIAAFCGNITWIYAMTGKKLDEAHQLANRGIQLSDSLKDNQLLSYNHNSKGLIFKTEGKYDLALYHFEKSNQAAVLANDQAVLAYNRQLMGEIALSKGNARQALEWFNESSGICSQLKLREILKDDYKGMANVYAALGDFRNAYHYFIKYTELKDSLLNWEITQRAILINRQADDEQQKKQLASLEQSARQAQREQLIFSVSFAIVFVLMSIVLILVLRNNRYRKIVNEELQKQNRQIEEQNRKLLQSSELRDKLFSIISHDLRSPLVSLRGMLGLLQKEQITEAEFRLFTPKINQLLTGMNETLENLLGWGQTQLGIMTIQPVKLFPHDVVKRIFDLFADMARAKNITLINEIDQLYEVTCDRNVLELVIRNLIHNSIKFSNPDSKVCVRAKTDNSNHIIEVADNGIGMSTNHLNEIFSGISGSSRGTMGEKGTGLGLRLCRELLERSGGRLEIESREGMGSVFRIILKKA